ncbi:MAG: hypothetical protein JWP25_4519 [Bradyrhizobium sp.]|jgi:hypothetical protein|nr:hypothetical protein [Bradyrhizobium sp.]MEA2866721.1 hypothetical protein [Bradyrhizobium sp.]
MPPPDFSPVIDAINLESTRGATSGLLRVTNRREQQRSQARARALHIPPHSEAQAQKH